MKYGNITANEPQCMTMIIWIPVIDLPAKAVLRFPWAFLPTLSFYSLWWALSFTLREIGWIWSSNKPDMIMPYSFALWSIYFATFPATVTKHHPRCKNSFFLTSSEVILKGLVETKKLERFRNCIRAQNISHKAYACWIQELLILQESLL